MVSLKLFIEGTSLFCQETANQLCAALKKNKTLRQLDLISLGVIYTYKEQLENVFKEKNKKVQTALNQAKEKAFFILKFLTIPHENASKPPVENTSKLPGELEHKLIIDIYKTFLSEYPFLIEKIEEIEKQYQIRDLIALDKNPYQLET